jgi:biuret amidohydrolase
VPLDLNALLAPGQVALLLMECQEGVIGRGGRMGALAEAVEKQGTVACMARLVAAARAARVPVFYCNMARRPDGGGTALNCLLLAAGKRSPIPLVPGSPQQAVVRELSPTEADYVITRFHGVAPFHGTELDQTLRNLGVRTVVAAGVSVNLGITGLTIEAVNAGYQVVIPRDAVAGAPESYVASVFEHTLKLLATLVTADQVLAAWGAVPG